MITPVISVILSIHIKTSCCTLAHCCCLPRPSARRPQYSLQSRCSGWFRKSIRGNSPRKPGRRSATRILVWPIRVATDATLEISPQTGIKPARAQAATRFPAIGSSVRAMIPHRSIREFRPGEQGIRGSGNRLRVMAKAASGSPFNYTNYCFKGRRRTRPRRSPVIDSNSPAERPLALKAAPETKAA